MTIGIVFSNGQEAITISDSRGTQYGRQSDAFVKAGVFETHDYKGLVFGAGDGEALNLVVNRLGKLHKPSLDEYCNEVFDALYKGIIDPLNEHWIASQKREIQKEASAFGDEDKKRDYIGKRTEELIGAYRQHKNAPENSTQLVMAAYDLAQECVRVFFLSPSYMSEKGLAHLEIGSGTDGAHAYMSSSLHGLNTKELELEALLFFAINAYTSAHLNQGVGGTPNVHIIDRQGVVVLELNRVNAMANLSAAYMSEIREGVLTRERMLQYLNWLLFEDKPKFGVIGKVIGMPKDNLTTLIVPQSEWQAHSNRVLFKKPEQ
jgi:hypothetical protein